MIVNKMHEVKLNLVVNSQGTIYAQLDYTTRHYLTYLLF